MAVLAAGGLALSASACGDAPDTPSGSGASAAAAGYKACMVTDTGGIDDGSFNSSAWAGIQAAKAAQSNVEPDYVSSSQEADYEPNLRGYVAKKCNFILAVGGLMGTATGKVATENPTQQFGIVDAKLPDNKNVFPMQFATQEASFLAGYLAAGYSKSGKVATFGGLPIPPVTVFMDGFSDGIAYYNQQKGKNVQLLGWDKAKQNGSFAQKFDDPNIGNSLSKTFTAQGADVLFPVAGRTGIGAGDVAKASGGKVSVIWVDTDGCKNNQVKQYCDVFLTTVVKNMTDAVKQAVVEGAQGKALASDPGYLGTLKNDGVSLGPFNQFESKVDPTLKAELTKLREDIIAGTVKVESKSAPA